MYSIFFMAKNDNYALFYMDEKNIPFLHPFKLLFYHFKLFMIYTLLLHSAVNMGNSHSTNFLVSRFITLFVL